MPPVKSVTEKFENILFKFTSDILKKFRMLSVCSGVAPLKIIPPKAED